MMPFLIQHLIPILIIIVVFLVLMKVAPLAFYFCIVLPFIIAREGYRMLMAKMNKKNLVEKSTMPYLYVLIFLLIILGVWVSSWF